MDFAVGVGEADFAALRNEKAYYVDKTEISSDAMKLFQRDLDIKNFTKLILDSKDDISYLEQMNELFQNGIVDAYEEDILSELASNKKLLDDIEQ